MTRSMLLHLKPAALLGAIALAACTSHEASNRATADTPNAPGASPAVSRAEQRADSIGASGVPGPVADVGRHGEDLYDQVKKSDWGKAAVTLDSLRTGVAALTAGERRAVQPALDSLRSAVAARHRDDALVAANRITDVGAAMTEAYHPATPADIVRLDYYGRELEIWSARGDLPALARNAAALRTAWGRVRPAVMARGGAAAALRTDSLVARLGAARTVAQYASLATPLLDVVDQLEKPFEH